MHTSIAEIVDDLIHTYDLHSRVPVSLGPLEVLFVPIRKDLARLGLAATAILPTGTISECNFAQIVLDESLGLVEDRLVYAHEVGHCILGHAGELRFMSMDEWFTDKMEREAWKVAARLLVPIDAVVEREDIKSIAWYCQVPEYLVTLAYL